MIHPGMWHASTDTATLVISRCPPAANFVVISISHWAKLKVGKYVILNLIFNRERARL